MKIFVINLKRSEGRRIRMEKALRKLNLNYEFFEAVDGYQLTPSELSNYIDPNNKYPRPFKPAEVGCFLSHYLVLKKIAEEGIPYALIMEDDVEVSERLPYVLEEVQKHINPTDVISLYTTFTELCKLYSTGRIDKKYSFIRPHKNELVLGTVAYIVTKSVAEEMTKNLMPINNVIDDWQFWINKGYVGDFRIIFPHPVDLSDNYSEIHESFGGPILKFKKLLINKFPLLSKFILNKRKKERWDARKKNILIDSKHPTELFY